ncbi:MAG: hypothetical protein BroJett040_08680 [Oligoflexia bacterium]|nr:MAG: hypothetical protein BroJett040_08680 [Oligoflexia bacterium]
MEKIVPVEQRRFFTREEAQTLLPLVYRITESSQLFVKKQMNRLEALKGSNPVLAAEIESIIDTEVARWKQKISRLGIFPKGLWLADFDSGEGYYCWKFPETEIRFSHGYQDGFTGRTELQ